MTKLQKRPGGDVVECAIRWAVEARRKGRGAEGEQEQATGQGGGRTQSDVPEVTSRFAEVRTGRGSAGFRPRKVAYETSRKGKGNGGKGEHEGKGGGFGSKGVQQGTVPSGA